jgi:hypothetical protein
MMSVHLIVLLAIAANALNVTLLVGNLETPFYIESSLLEERSVYYTYNLEFLHTQNNQNSTTIRQPTIDLDVFIHIFQYLTTGYMKIYVELPLIEVLREADILQLSPSFYDCVIDQISIQDYIFILKESSMNTNQLTIAAEKAKMNFYLYSVRNIDSFQEYLDILSFLPSFIIKLATAFFDYWKELKLKSNVSLMDNTFIPCVLVSAYHLEEVMGVLYNLKMHQIAATFIAMRNVAFSGSEEWSEDFIDKLMIYIGRPGSDTTKHFFDYVLPYSMTPREMSILFSFDYSPPRWKWDCLVKWFNRNRLKSGLVEAETSLSSLIDIIRWKQVPDLARAKFTNFICTFEIKPFIASLVYIPLRVKMTAWMYANIVLRASETLERGLKYPSESTIISDLHWRGVVEQFSMKIQYQSINDWLLVYQSDDMSAINKSAVSSFDYFDDSSDRVMILKTTDGGVVLGYLYSHPPYIVGTFYQLAFNQPVVKYDQGVSVMKIVEQCVDFSSRDALFSAGDMYVSAEDNGSRGSIFGSGNVTIFRIEVYEIRFRHNA